MQRASPSVKKMCVSLTRPHIIASLIYIRVILDVIVVVASFFGEFEEGKETIVFFFIFYLGRDYTLADIIASSVAIISRDEEEANDGGELLKGWRTTEGLGW